MELLSIKASHNEYQVSNVLQQHKYSIGHEYMCITERKDCHYKEYIELAVKRSGLSCNLCEDFPRIVLEALRLLKL
jgi:hypothetical protein